MSINGRRRRTRIKISLIGYSFFNLLVLIIYFPLWFKFYQGLNKSLRWKRWPFVSNSLILVLVHYEGLTPCSLSPLLQQDLLEGFKCPAVEPKPEDTIILLWQFDIFKYALNFLFLFIHGTLVFFSCSCPLFVYLHYTIKDYKASVLKHATWVDASI